MNGESLFAAYGTSPQGLPLTEAEKRIADYGHNVLGTDDPHTSLRVLWSQLRSPLLLLLVFAAAISMAMGQWSEALLVGSILGLTVGIGFKREFQAFAAVAALQRRVGLRARVRREGQPRWVPVEDVVPGDILLLAAGSIVPADAVLLETEDLHVSEAELTGESFPVEKKSGPLPERTSVGDRSNCVFRGTNVRTGAGVAVVVCTGAATEFGRIAQRLKRAVPSTEFERGLSKFGTLMTMTMLVMVILVFLAHVMQGRPPVENLLFAVALAVGLSPELLPAILTVNLARGAEMMAKHGVLVRRLNAIENLGSMDILCTDKTGTLTEGVVKLQGAYDASGEASENVLRVGRLNARFQAGLPSALDDALLMENDETEEAWTKVAEVPFDFSRKRVSVVLDGLRGTRLVTKGALAHVLEACVELDDGTLLDSQRLERLHSLAETWAAQGIRVLGVAEREVPRKASYDRFDERDLRFLGFLTFTDRPKDGAAQALKALAQLGVTVKMITGDSRLVAQHVAGLIGFPNVRMLTGEVLDTLQNEALWRMAEDTDIFAEVDPNQKERIILALKRSGHVVGFLGDGVNDAPAMHASDVSLSVQYAVDVARATADFVLLERSLDVIHRGIAEGRKTFANTLKYILTTTSANLGNMASMALASLVLPFLPLTAGQILLNNVLSDIPAVGIAEDSVDPEWVASPKRWNMRFIGHFMVEFGALSSVFDLMTYGTLLLGFRCSEDLFRTGWFVESLLSELVVALVVRTRRPFFQSRPGRLLLVLTGILVPTTFAIPYLPFARFMGFVPLPMPVALTIAGIAALYVLCAETLKGAVYRSFGESA